MTVNWSPGFHAPDGRHIDRLAYERYIGRWSRLFVPALLVASEISQGDKVLDVATGTGEVASLAKSAVGDSGFIIGTDISAAMLLAVPSPLSVVSDGQALPFPDGRFDAVLCQLGLMFFPDPLQGLKEFRRVLHYDRRATVCVISSPDRAPMWGILADALSQQLPDQREMLHMSFRLANSSWLERLFLDAGFRDVNVTHETREGILGSFDEYWSPIETGVGQLPQAYCALPEPNRRQVRAEVQQRLLNFEIDGRYVMSVEMLLGSGRA